MLRSYTSTARIAATAERVWPVLSDVLRWPQWLPTMTSVERIGTGPLAVDARYRLEQPRLRPTIWTVVSLEPPYAFGWEARWPGARALATHTLIAAPGESCNIILEVHFRGALSLLASAIAGRTVREYLAREVAALKKQVEERP